jgi:hypothetical protein
VLIYPRRLAHPFRAEVGGISVLAVSFPIDGDVEAGGRGFVEEIAAVLPRAHMTAWLRAPEGLGTIAAATFCPSETKLFPSMSRTPPCRGPPGDHSPSQHRDSLC